MMPIHHKSYRIEMGHDPRPGASWRRQLGLGEVVPVEIPDAVLTAQLDHNAKGYSDITASICGDPLPGESAYDRGPTVTIAPYDPVRNYVPYQADAISPREKQRQTAQIRRSSRHRGWRLTHTKGEG